MKHGQTDWKPLREIRVSEDDDNWIIVFSDNGPGIPEELLKDNRLFNPGETSKEGGLSGYGLAICKDMVESMNGTISIHSVKDKGAAFTIVLPKKINTPLTLTSTYAIGRFVFGKALRAAFGISEYKPAAVSRIERRICK